MVRWVVYILAVLLIVTQAIAAPCTFSTTPIIDLLVENITVPQGERLQGTVSLGNNITAILDVSSVDNHPITLQDGKWNLTVNTQKNHIRYLFYAVADTSCTATKLLTINVLHPPLLKALNPQAGNVTLQEGHGITFRVNSSLPGVWTLDGVQVSTIKSYAYRSSYNDAGNYLVRFRAKDTNNLQSEIIWNLSITNVNRAPLLLSRIRGIAIPINGTASANLSNYFVDPDGTRLDYSYVLEYPSNLSSIAKGEAKIELRENIIELTGIIPGTFFLTFTATDLHGAQAKSDPVTFKVIDAKLQTVDGYCGDKVCTAPENCLTCTKDCGVCKECVPQWDCTEWNSCLAEGFEYRTCIVINRCDNMTDPATARQCDYTPTCTDGLQNGDEEGVDCGGQCEACPSCRDGILNQHEEKIDCGGPCDACATCSDGIHNQNESDIDCGVGCNACAQNSRCNSNLDCDSRSCVNGRCTAPSCSDQLLNQGEDQVDCGGPCDTCPTCFDEIKNQGELQTDCGGPCISCPTCYDNVKNQDEKRIDCGGSCRECTLSDYSHSIRLWIFWSLGIFLALMIIYFTRVILTSRLIFLIQHNKTIYFFHEDEPTFAILFWWNRFWRYLRINRHKEFQQIIEKTYIDLSSMRRLPDQQLRPVMIQALRDMYAKILSLPVGFDYDIFIPAIRRAHLPFAVKVIILKNSKILYLIEKTRLYGDAGFAVDDVLRSMKYLTKTF